MTRRLIVAALTLGLLGAVGVGGYTLVNSTTVQAFGGLTARVETDRKVVALTFDDGPTCADLDGTLAALGGVRGTFFVVGSQAAECPGGIERLVAAGHEVGNHTWSHRRMIFLTPDAVAGEIEPTDAVIRASGQSGEILVRPPYGKKLLVMPWWLSQHGRRTVTWDVAVETFDGERPDAATIARRTVERTRPGSIILLHPWSGSVETQRAIPLVIAELRARGYTFATASELLDA